MKIIDDLHGFLWLNPTANNCNTYLINGNKKVLVDPGHDHLFGHVEEGLSKLSISPDEIDLVIITHGHPDHMEGVKRFESLPAMVAIPEGEIDFIRQIVPNYGDTFGVPDFEPDILLQEGDLKVGDLDLQVIHTPGHSPNSICLYWPTKKVLFSGDVAFNQGIGRTDLPGGNGQALKESIKKISRLDIDYLLTGHGEIVSGHDQVKNNFRDIENYWFAYI